MANVAAQGAFSRLREKLDPTASRRRRLLGELDAAATQDALFPAPARGQRRLALPASENANQSGDRR